MNERQKWQNVLDRLRFWESKDDSYQKALDDFCKVIAPDEYSPIMSRYGVRGFLDGFCQEDKKLREDLEYWLFEASWAKGSALVQFNDQKWDFKKDEDVIDYLTKFYPLKCKT